MSKKLTTLEFIIKAKSEHGEKYDYSKVEYLKSNTKVIIICANHGDFEQTPNDHLKGKGCPKCGLNSRVIKNTSSKEEYIVKFIETHGSTYDYSEYEYINNRVKSTIICKLHGKFNQTPKNHMQGRGCPKCGKESHWRRSDYIKKAKGRICTFYVIGCFNESEGFYKVGITMNNLKKRYRSTKEMPYNYEIISEVFGEAGIIWDLELQEKRKLKEFHYRPLIDFDGSRTECFTEYE